MERIPVQAGSKARLRLGKSWQSTQTMGVWQASFLGSGGYPLPKKFFFVCQISRNKAAIELVEEKPPGVTAQGHWAQLTRKYVGDNAMVEHIWHHRERYETWVPLRKGSFVGYYLRLQNHNKQASFELIDPELTSLVRCSEKGVFTKKWLVEKVPDFVEEGFQDLLPQKLDDLMDRYEQLVEKRRSTETESVESVEISQPQEGLNPVQAQIKKKLVRRLKTVRKAFAKTQNQLPSSELIAEQELKAKLLQSYSYLVKPQMHELVLSSDLTGAANQVVIDLDPDVSVGQNMEQSFLKIKKLKKALEHGKIRLKKEQHQLYLLEDDVSRLISAQLNPQDLEIIINRYDLSLEQNPQRISGSEKLSCYRAFYGPEGELIWVGKGPRENDELAKMAKSNDFWLHVVSGTGSHIVIPAKGLGAKKRMSERLKKDAAILAVHFSKLRGNQAAEVYFTQKQHIKKKKGLPVGLWLVEKSENIYVKYTESELKQILSRKPANPSN